MTIRHLEKFESTDASISYAFPLAQYEWEPGEDFRVAYASAVGANYAHDYYGFDSAPRAIARETVRCMLTESTESAMESELDEMRNELQRIGLGKLFLIDSDSTRRWAYARPTGLPRALVAAQNAGKVIPVTLSFDRLSHWFGSSQTTGSQAISSSPTDVTVNNPGNIPATAMTFRLRANASAGFTNTGLENTGNDYSISTTRDSASADDEIRIDTEKLAVEYSDDDGATYSNDYSNVSLGATQVGFMRLEPGDNTIRVTSDGTPDFQFSWSFYAPYA